MEGLLRRWMEITFTVVIVIVVLSRSSAFGSVVRALSAAYSESVRALTPGAGVR